MTSHRAKGVVLSIILLVPIYLVIVGIWASTSIEDLLADYPREPVDISPGQKILLLSIEDPTFYEHRGVDVSPGQGLTTITSSIARDIYLFGADLEGLRGRLQSFYRGVFNCCKRIDLGRDVMALVLNNHLSKEDQLDIFLANVYMGSHAGKQIRGLEEAAKTYYAKPLNQTDNTELTGLIAMMEAPNRYHPVKNPTMHEQRRAKIEKVISGECQPSGWLDTTYENC